MLDTIGEVFEGEKQLFEGLWIHDSDYEFVKHPVIKLDMSNISNETPGIFKISLLAALKKRVLNEKLDITDEIPSDLFKHLIEELHKKYGRGVVVLIDEYDKPILDHLGNYEIAEANRQILKGFYGILKSMDPYLRLVFITGVSKFTKTSIFSDLNNLLDITLDKKYSNICGITISEFDKYFNGYIEHLSMIDDFKHIENLRDKVLDWYDGYSWDGNTRVLNPYSLLGFFIQEKFSSYWFASGTPKFLMDLIKNNPGVYTKLKNLEITELMLDSSDIDKISIELMLFQTGYLTVKKVISTSRAPIFALDMPNYEIKEAFNLYIIAALTENNEVRAGQAQIEIINALQNGDMQKMRNILKSLFASIPYQLHINREAYYHSIIYAIMNILGFDIDAEVSVSNGRVDAVLILDDMVYVMEFKYKECASDLDDAEKQEIFNNTLKEAMDQIKDRGYHVKYINSDKAVYLTAFAFLGRDDIEMEVSLIN